MRKIFTQLRERIQKDQTLLPMEKRAIFWFQDYATYLNRWQTHHENLTSRGPTATFQKLTEGDFTKQIVAANRVQPGFFYFYVYDPKLKKTLPYYDKFPFVLCLKADEPGRFMGLNFHYLDYRNRARLFDALYSFREGRPERPTVRDIRMRLRVTYDILKISSKYKAFKPCLKEYLVGHLRTPMMKVGAKEWDIALFLPVHMFEKHTASYVWNQSEKTIK